MDHFQRFYSWALSSTLPHVNRWPRRQFRIVCNDDNVLLEIVNVNLSVVVSAPGRFHRVTGVCSLPHRSDRRVVGCTALCERLVLDSQWQPSLQSYKVSEWDPMQYRNRAVLIHTMHVPAPSDYLPNDSSTALEFELGRSSNYVFREFKVSSDKPWKVTCDIMFLVAFLVCIIRNLKPVVDMYRVLSQGNNSVRPCRDVRHRGMSLRHSSLSISWN